MADTSGDCTRYFPRLIWRGRTALDGRGGPGGAPKGGATCIWLARARTPLSRQLTAPSKCARGCNQAGVSAGWCWHPPSCAAATGKLRRQRPTRGGRRRLRLFFRVFFFFLHGTGVDGCTTTTSLLRGWGEGGISQIPLPCGLVVCTRQAVVPGLPVTSSGASCRRGCPRAGRAP